MRPRNSLNLTAAEIDFIVHLDFPRLVALMAFLFTGVLDFGYFRGQIDGNEPPHNVGAWLRNRASWWTWNTGFRVARYFPNQLATGHWKQEDDTVLLHTLTGTTHRPQGCILNLPAEDHNGDTLATLDDIHNNINHNINNTLSMSGTAFNLNFDAHSRAYIEPSGNFSIDAVGGKDGDKMDLWIKSPMGPSTSTAAVWPSSWIVGAGSIPSTSAGQYKLTHVELSKLGGMTFVKFKKTFTFGPGGDSINVVAPTVVSISSISNSGIIDIEFNRLLKGSSIAASDFLITKNTLPDVITSVLVTGFHVYLSIANAYTASDIGQITYGGLTAIKDTDGNAAAPFGPSDIEMNSSGNITQFTGTTGYSGQLPAMNNA